MKRRWPIWMWTLWGVAACDGTPLPPPLIEEACLLNGADCVAGMYAGEDGVLVIRGQGLFQGFDCDLGSDEPLPLSGSFSAWVGDRPVERLVPEVWREGEPEALRGYLGAGLWVGRHPVRVRAPSGQQGERPDALVVANPLSIEGTIADPRPRLGGRLTLSLRLQNLGRARLTGLRLGFSESGTGDLDLPGVQTLEPLEALGSRSLVFEIPARGVGRVDLGVLVQAVAADSVPLQAEGSWPVEVNAP
ncbi:MAG: hypothetical protein GYA21_17995 [Myxococcales bacterium]|nr:hypothetical protein [Myxococcales bacterium]